MPVAPTPNPPAADRDFVAKAVDLDEIKKAVEDAAAVSGPLWISYLFALFYVALAAAGVTHTDLLLENPVELPFLSIKLPLKAFFVMAPILLLISHAYTMAHFALLAEKAKGFHLQLRKTIDARDDAHDIREGWRRQLPINMFVQFLAGPEDIREGMFSVLLWGIVWTSLVAGPILVLLLLHLQFLPYHDSRVTWVHRIALAGDLWIHWSLWMMVLSGRSPEDDATQQASAPRGFRARTRAFAASVPWAIARGWDCAYHYFVGRWLGAAAPAPPCEFWRTFKKAFLRFCYVAAMPLTPMIVIFSWMIFTYPGEWRSWPYSWFSLLETRGVREWNEYIFGHVDALSGEITGSWPANTLRLKGFDIYAALKVDSPGKVDWKEHIYDWQNRRLEYADFSSANFGKADLRNASLRGSLLAKAELRGAGLDGADLRGASLADAHLQGATLERTLLGGASLVAAQLQGASLKDVDLLGAAADRANLEGAWLDGAQLEAASLSSADLRGASLRTARLAGAEISLARFDGASLLRAQLQGQTLDLMDFAAVDLSGAFLWRARISASKPVVVELQFPPNWNAVEELAFGVFLSWRKAYDALQTDLLALPPGWPRKNALSRTKFGPLDCTSSEKTLAPCADGAINASYSDSASRLLNKAATNRAAYPDALAEVLRGLACNGAPNAIYVLRGVIANGRLAAGDKLVADALANTASCSFGAALSDDDKARLLQLKQKP